ncbi:MAG TPA: hypothetical protein VLI39_09260 [Sedimentisphaerales bacterium]|nr:hypothetical protein [Sedimentisphaerales bacterium]
MTRRAAFREQAWPEEPVFKELALQWADSVSERVLDWVWRAFDTLAAGPMARVDLSEPLVQLERDLTNLHFLEIQTLWARETDDFPALRPCPEIPELESRHSPSARPPAYDFGFVHRENPRIVWPIEAKIVQKASVLGRYLKDVRDKFIAGIAAPFVGQAGMIGYLLAGTAREVFDGLETELGQSLTHPSAFASRDHRTSFHTRGRSPFGRDLPDLLLHHLVMRCS